VQTTSTLTNRRFIRIRGVACPVAAPAACIPRGSEMNISSACQFTQAFQSVFLELIAASCTNSWTCGHSKSVQTKLEISAANQYKKII